MIQVYHIVIFLLLSCCVQAQTTVYKGAFNFGFLWTDYNSLDPIYQQSNSGRFLHPEDVNYAIGIGYQYALNSSFDIGAVARIGSIDAHYLVYKSNDTLCQPCEDRIREEFFVSGDVIGQYKFANGYLLPKNFLLRPYIFMGVGLVHMQKREIKADVQLPVGIGFRVHLSPAFALQIQGEYRKSLLVAKDNLALSLGIVWLMNPKKES